MSKKTRTWSVVGLLGATLALAIVMLPTLLRGRDVADSTVVPAKSGLILHEWGTFTSFSGSDGVNLEYRPSLFSDLPSFVVRAPSVRYIDFSKASFVARQRMETPVIYFYTDRPQTVDVRVDFPDGMLTEWYPVVKEAQPGEAKADGSIEGRSYLDWGSVRLTPPAQFSKIKVRGKDDKPQPASLFTINEKNHYGHARGTDSAVVETLDQNGASHFEKFLFYRGVGNFELPLTLVARGQDYFEVTNASALSSGPMIMVRIDGGRVRFARHASLAPGQSAMLMLSPEELPVEALSAAMVEDLCAAGLYEKEAVSMVRTWHADWFGESGTRLLYLLPEQITDQLLPLTVSPRPDEQVRVLVGRLETLTPEDGKQLIELFMSNDGDDPAEVAKVQAELDKLGRFADPALEFLMGKTKDDAVRQRLQKVLDSIKPKDSTLVPLSAAAGG